MTYFIYEFACKLFAGLRNHFDCMQVASPAVSERVPSSPEKKSRQEGSRSEALLRARENAVVAQVSASADAALRARQLRTAARLRRKRALRAVQREWREQVLQALEKRYREREMHSIEIPPI